MKLQANTTCITLVRSNQTLTGKMRSSVIRSMTWWISGLTRELVASVWMWSIWSVRSQIRKSSAMVPCSILIWRKWIKLPLAIRICSPWEKLGGRLQRLPSNTPIQKIKNCPWFSNLNTLVFNTNRVNQNGTTLRNWMCQNWKKFSPSGRRN